MTVYYVLDHSMDTIDPSIKIYAGYIRTYKIL